MKFFPSFDRRLSILLVAQAIAGSTGPVLFLVSGFTGPKLAPTLVLSTLPMSLVVVGIALASGFASWVMARIGRKSGHLLGLAVTIFGVVLAAVALVHSLFTLYCLACFICGAGNAFSNQIRFTAAEAAPFEEKALVHSWVLTFSLFAALLGPWIASFGRTILDTGEYTGSLAILGSVLLLLFFLLFALPADAKKEPILTATRRIPVRELLKEGRFWLAAFAGIASFATMTLLMSATPLQMHEIAHFSVEDTTKTIQSHIVAMFLPSLFSGVLLAWFGVRRLILLGIALFLICIPIAYQSEHFHHYWWALVLLGVGWNFLFLAGSTWVSQSYVGEERFAAQGANDTLVYGTQACASLLAGWLLFQIGWKQLVLVPIPLLLGLLIFVMKKMPARKSAPGPG